MLTCSGGEPYPYRVARISQVDLTEVTFEYPPAAKYDPAACSRHVFGVHVSQKSPVEEEQVRLSGSWARYPLRHRWHKTQEERVEGDPVVVTLRVRVCPEMETWALGFGEFAEVLAPESLRRWVAERQRRASDVYARAESTSVAESV